MMAESNRRSHFFLVRTQPIKSHNLFIYQSPPNFLFLSIKWYTNTFLYTVADLESMTYQQLRASTRLLVSNIVNKGNQTPWRMSDSRTGVENIHDEPGASCNARNGKCLKHTHTHICTQMRSIKRNQEATVKLLMAKTRTI